MMRVLLFVGVIALFSPLHAQTSSPSASPSLEQRVADLEAYVNNSARGADTGSPMASNIAGPGPGHNAWMMTCAALVLFIAPARKGRSLRRPCPRKERPFRAGAMS